MDSSLSVTLCMRRGLSYKNHLLFPFHLFDGIFPLTGFAHGFECLRVYKLHGSADLGVVSSGLQMIVLVEPFLHIIGGTRIERVVAAAEDVGEVGHIIYRVLNTHRF